MFLFLFGILTTQGQQKTHNTSKSVVKYPDAEAPAKTGSVSFEKERLVEIKTPFGIMTVKLYNSTPLHRDNFIKKVEAGFYDSLLFHRVIKDFMIQGGDTVSKNAPDSLVLGAGSAPGERIPAEFINNFFHKKGALAAARDGNPEKASSNCQFYIVQGKKTDTAQLRQIEQGIIKGGNGGFKYSKNQKEIYQRIGGTPFLDQNYTVFGEVVSGLEVLDKIESVKTKPGDRPLVNIWMKMKMIN